MHSCYYSDILAQCRNYRTKISRNRVLNLFSTTIFVSSLWNDSLHTWRVYICFHTEMWYGLQAAGNTTPDNLSESIMKWSVIGTLPQSPVWLIAFVLNENLHYKTSATLLQSQFQQLLLIHLLKCETTALEFSCQFEKNVTGQ